MGFTQFVTQKRKMVSDFEIFKEMSENRPTETDKGRYAEALFRNWLTQFLPAKYGVTSGYIITQKNAFASKETLKGTLRHYDVVIYNKLESPILWDETNPDHSLAGTVRAIPAEYVHSVIEVKSTMNVRSISDAIKKLNELKPLLVTEDRDERYKGHVSTHFYMGMVFFELLRKEQGNTQLLNHLVPAHLLKGFFGGIVLSAEGRSPRKTGYFKYVEESSPYPKIEFKTLVPKDGGLLSDSMETTSNKYVSCMLSWYEQNLSLFAFDLISVMNGTYLPGLLSSFHGM